MNEQMSSFVIVIGIAVFLILFITISIVNYFQTRSLKKHFSNQLYFLYESLTGTEEE